MMEAVSYTLESSASLEEQVEAYAPLVKRIAWHLKGRLPDHVPVEDLIQVGMIGLLDALRHYEEGHGASFETYAGIRIRGAMLDELRRNDWTPRSVHRKARGLSDAMRRVENREGRAASDSELARELGINVSQYHEMLQDASGQRLVSFEEMGLEDESALERIADSGPGVVELLEDGEQRELLAEAISELPQREQLVMALYYDEELNLKEIGKVLGVTESRICQIHSQALLRLRAILRESAAALSW